MIVFYTASRNLYEHLYPPIMSLLDTNPDVEKIYVVCEDDSLGWDTPKQVECINVSGQQVFPSSGPNYRTSYSHVTLMRAYIANLVPDTVERIIQLDADTIIADSLQPLWDMDLEGKWIAACKENEFSTQKAFLSLDDRYFNVGVAVLNLKQIREDEVTGKLVNYLNTAQAPWIDQDAWNLIGLRYRKIVEIEDVRYNECFVVGYTSDPAVVHYCAVQRWWDNLKSFRHEYWEKYQRQPEPKTPKNTRKKTKKENSVEN